MALYGGRDTVKMKHQMYKTQQEMIAYKSKDCIKGKPEKIKMTEPLKKNRTGVVIHSRQASHRRTTVSQKPGTVA